MNLYPQPRPCPCPCPGCGRVRPACFSMPCLHLERVLARGTHAVQAWVRAGLPARMRGRVIVRRYAEDA